MKKQPKQKTAKKCRALIWVLGVLLVLAAAVAIHYRGVRPIRIAEFGEKLSAEDFTSREAALETDEKLSCGWHVLNLSIGGVPTPVLAIVRDTVAPTAEAIDRIVPVGSAPGPDTFVRNVKDADIVRVAFEETPDFGAEWDGTVVIVLSDRSENRTDIPVHVSVRATVRTLTVEAGEEIPVADRFLIEGVRAGQETPIGPEMLHHVGTYPIAFVTDSGVRSVSELIVADTQAPSADPTLLLLASGETAEAEAFAQNAADETDLSYAFVSEPDYSSREVYA